MFVLWLVAVAIIAAIGLIVKFITDRMETEHDITWKEFAIVMAAFAVVVAPLSVWLGWNIAKDSQLTFYESWHGWETGTYIQEFTCTRDGPCAWEYDCDPYQCHCHDVCDSHDEDGDCTSSHEECSTCYHDCPYCDREYSYIVNTTLRDFAIAEHRFPENPDAHRWNSWVSVPRWVVEKAGVGAPRRWLEAKARVEANNPDPVTIRAPYQSPLYVTQNTFKRYGAKLDYFRKLNLLPGPVHDIYDFYRTDEVFFVGYEPETPGEIVLWQKHLQRLNGAFYHDLQGDLRLVIVGAPEAVAQPDDWFFALLAYWSDEEYFGKNLLEENTIVVALFTEDGQTVSRVRAAYGLPMGNEYLVQRLQTTLVGTRLSAGVILGEFGADLPGAQTRLNEPGLIGDLLWGVTETSTKFAKVDIDKQFGYLLTEVEPTGGQKTWIVVCACVFGLIGWVIAFFVGERVASYRRSFG